MGYSAIYVALDICPEGSHPRLEGISQHPGRVAVDSGRIFVAGEQGIQINGSEDGVLEVEAARWAVLHPAESSHRLARELAGHPSISRCERSKESLHEFLRRLLRRLGGLPVAGALNREVQIKEDIERGTVGVGLDQGRGERLAEAIALVEGDLRQRPGGVDGLAERDRDARLP